MKAGAEMIEGQKYVGKEWRWRGGEKNSGEGEGVIEGMKEVGEGGRRSGRAMVVVKEEVEGEEGGRTRGKGG